MRRRDDWQQWNLWLLLLGARVANGLPLPPPLLACAGWSTRCPLRLLLLLLLLLPCRRHGRRPRCGPAGLWRGGGLPHHLLQHASEERVGGEIRQYHLRVRHQLC